MTVVNIRGVPRNVSFTPIHIRRTVGEGPCIVVRDIMDPLTVWQLLYDAHCEVVGPKAAVPFDEFFITCACICGVEHTVHVPDPIVPHRCACGNSVVIHTSALETTDAPLVISKTETNL